MHVSFYLEKARNCEGPDWSPQSGATDLGLECLLRATNSFLRLQYDLSKCLESMARLTYT